MIKITNERPNNVIEKYLYESGKSKLKQIFYGIFPKIDTLGIITAENPMEIKYESAVNLERNNNLEKSISYYGFRLVKGQHDNKGNYYNINNIDTDYLMLLAITYQQKSFIYAEKYEKNNQIGVNFYYYAQKWLKNFKSNEIDYCLSKINDLDREFLLSYMKLNNGYYKLNDEFINILHKNDALTREELVIITRFVNILDSYNIQIGNNIFHKISERKMFMNTDNAEDFYTEYNGFKFMTPFFDSEYNGAEKLSKKISYSKDDFAENNLYEEYKNERDKINKAIPNSSAQSRAANRLAQYRLLNQIENKIGVKNDNKNNRKSK